MSLPTLLAITPTTTAHITYENLLTEVNFCKRSSIEKRAKLLSIPVAQYRQALQTAFTQGCPKEQTGVAVRWSLWDWENSEEWMPRKQANYPWPKEIVRISEQLQLFFLEVGIYLNRDWSNIREAYETLGEVTLSYIDWAEAFVIPKMKATSNEHVMVHLYEVLTTYCMTLIQFYEFVSHYPHKMESETRPECVDMYCHPLIGGLTVTEYVFEERDAKRATQKPRSPSQDTNRSGKDISFEELANIYRTSRVTLSNIFSRILAELREGMNEELTQKTKGSVKK